MPVGLYYVPVDETLNTVMLLLYTIFRIIYIITDYNSPPKFQTYTLTQQFSRINSGVIMDGYVYFDGLNTNIRIQAALNSTFFDRPNENFFDFIIGDGSTTSNNGRTFLNPALRSGATLYSYYYILFEDENGVCENMYEC